jgi:hypothetical protein
MRRMLYAKLITYAIAIGTGATLIMDLWAVTQRRVFGVRPMDYALVGRWLGHMLHGQWRHDAIAKASPVAGERLLGWAAHYATGIVFAGGLLGIWGIDWVRHPTLVPALIVGVATIVFPFFILQPAFGAGVAASRMPQPNVARLRSLVTHTMFGFGLYLTALLLSAALPGDSKSSDPPRFSHRAAADRSQLAPFDYRSGSAPEDHSG